MRSLLLVLALTACQSGEASSPPPPRPTVDPAYRADIEKLCDVMKLSGADQEEEGNRMYWTANWLGNNLTTEAGRDFMVTVTQEPDGAKKGAMLRAEATKLGLTSCPLADSWR